MKNKLPLTLFRGDCDENNRRKFKETYSSGILLTNLCDGGTGKEIFSRSLKNSIIKHVHFGWKNTHFLSFSESKETALAYGSRNKAFEELEFEDQVWSFGLITLDTRTFHNNTIVELEEGIYKAEFTPINKEFLPLYPILLIDLVTYLQSLNEYTDESRMALTKAKLDTEWLLLPAFPFQNNELSGRLDKNCIEQIERFQFTSP